MVTTLGVAGIASLALSPVYAFGTGEQVATAAPFFAGAVGHSDVVTAMLIMDWDQPDDPGPGVNERHLEAVDAGVTVSSVSLVVTEGDQVTYNVRLDARPSAGVIINISAETNSEVTISPDSLTFTPDNWDEPQDVTVTTRLMPTRTPTGRRLSTRRAAGSTNRCGLMTCR